MSDLLTTIKTAEAGTDVLLTAICEAFVLGLDAEVGNILKEREAVLRAEVSQARKRNKDKYTLPVEPVDRRVA